MRKARDTGYGNDCMQARLYGTTVVMEVAKKTK